MVAAALGMGSHSDGTVAWPQAAKREAANAKRDSGAQVESLQARIDELTTRVEAQQEEVAAVRQLHVVGAVCTNV